MSAVWVCFADKDQRGKKKMGGGPATPRGRETMSDG